MMSPTDPFRFDDRVGHYGSGQADLAPVSPVAAPPRADDAPIPLDPMGASPDEGRVSDRREDTEIADGRVVADLNARAESQASVASTPTPSTPAASNAQAGVDATAGARIATPEAPARMDDAPSQTVLMRSDIVTSADVATDTSPVTASSGAPTPLLMPDSVAASSDSAGDFATMAARMDQLMADMAARMNAPLPSAPDDDDADPASDRLAEAQDRLDDLVGSLSDRIGTDVPTQESSPSTDALSDARDRLDDLASGLGLRSVNGLEDDADTPTASSDGAGSALLARLFDGDAAPDESSPVEARLANLVDELDDPAFLPPVPDFDPGRWDDLPDFG